ncbi:hypothetical protein [Comamonas sp. MYb69]|uniref:hypothetical protein n=1 Tax=Comamonas sp. MYb69 TaxID=1848650 RepID=UPI00309CE263
MSYGQILLFFFLCWLSYFAYWLLSRGPPRAPGFLRGPLKATIALKDLSSKKHWARGETVKVADDGTYTANIFRVAGNSFGENANRDCIAFLVPEEGKENTDKPVSVVVDGLRIGQLSVRDLMPFKVMLQDAGLHAQITSCDAYIGGGGTGVDGKKRSYAISLDVDWFEA